jgi:DNA-binding transcriptional regulator YiaG
VNLDEYAAKVDAYHCIFNMLYLCRWTTKTDAWRGFKPTKRSSFLKETTEQIREILANTEAHRFKRVKTGAKVSLADFASILNIHLSLDDLPSWEHDLENFKQIVMLLPRLVKSTEPQPFKIINDFIRDDNDKIIMPFDHWQEIVEIFMLDLRVNSSARIAREHSFKTIAKATGNTKAKEAVVKKALQEADKLITAAYSGNFPPPAISLWLPAKNKN